MLAGGMAMSRMGRPLRPRPNDFEPAFVILGRVACEDYYRTSVDLVDRWLGEIGMDRLKSARAAFVRARKAMLGRQHQQAPRIVSVSQMEAHRSARAVRGAFPHVIIEPVMGRCWQVGDIVISSAEMKALGDAVSPLSDEADLGHGAAAHE